MEPEFYVIQMWDGWFIREWSQEGQTRTGTFVANLLMAGRTNKQKALNDAETWNGTAKGVVYSLEDVIP